MRIGGNGSSPWANSEEEPLSEEEIVGGTSPSARTAQLILKAISDGSLTVGERLPSERTLAEELNVGRSAVREALSALEVLGVLEVIPGSGTYVRSPTSEVLPQTLSWGLLLKRDSVEELADVREALEVQISELVAGREPGVGLASLEESLRVQERAIDVMDVDAYVHADQRFHVELARLCGNSILAYLASSVRALLRVWIERQVREEDDMRVALAEHSEVLRCLQSGDTTSAAAAMRAHMRTASARIKQQAEELAEHEQI
jgi:Transcriptional regulators